ncbi:MAG: hypothetical protein QXU17_06035 [Archaeoglobaceae archaeon]
MKRKVNRRSERKPKLRPEYEAIFKEVVKEYDDTFRELSKL